MEKFVTLLASGLAYGAVLMLVALGFVVLYKATGVVNFAHGALVTLGAYVAVWAVAEFGAPILVAYLAAIVALFVFGLLLERVAFAPLRKRPPIVVVISTLAASLVIQGVLVLWQGSTPKRLASPVSDGVVGVFGASVSAHSILVIAVSAVIVSAVLAAFSRTSLGWQVQALASDPEMTQLCAVPVRRVSLIVFGLSASLAAIAGVLIAPLGTVDLQLGFSALVAAFSAVVLGGFGSLGGTAIAALGIGIVEKVVGGYLMPDYAPTLPLIVLIVVLAFRPDGLVIAQRSRL